MGRYLNEEIHCWCFLFKSADGWRSEYYRLRNDSCSGWTYSISPIPSIANVIFGYIMLYNPGIFPSCHWSGKWIQLLHFLWSYSSKVHLLQSSVMVMGRGGRSSGEKWKSLWNLKETLHEVNTVLLLFTEIHASYCPASWSVRGKTDHRGPTIPCV